MNIYAEKGTKVIFVETNVSQAQINYGGHTDPRNILEVGKIYTIQKTDVRSSHTKVYLEEFKDIHFNSVWFRDITTEDIQLMLDVIMFYGDPDIYFAISFLIDPPCGDFIYDFDDEYDEYDRRMPGAKARKVLSKILNK